MQRTLTKPFEVKRRKNRIKLIGVIIIGVALLWLAKLTLWESNPVVFSEVTVANTDTSENVIGSQQRELLKQDEVLHNYLISLQMLDETYSSLLTDTANKGGLLEMNTKISSLEESFRKAIDSVAKMMPANPNLADENIFLHMITSFRQALENRQLISNLRTAISTDKTVLNPDEKLMLKLKNELLVKETAITDLENELKSMKEVINNRTAAATTANTTIKEENELMKERSLEKDKRIASLTALNKTLQTNYDRVAKQASEAGKNTEVDNNSIKSRYASLENKIDELNTELRLAQVDCNLARADASQIISNSKQRRLLLSEALTILNSLSKPDNAYIQKKIQDKKMQLNKVATNYRD